MLHQKRGSHMRMFALHLYVANKYMTCVGNGNELSKWLKGIIQIPPPPSAGEYDRCRLRSSGAGMPWFHSR